MTFADILAAHVRAHPSLQPQDALKLCYQAACGPEHLLDDLETARQRFDDEFTATPPRQGPLWEAVSDSYVRVDLGAWKAKGLPAGELFGLFAASAGAPGGNSLPMEALLDTVYQECHRREAWEERSVVVMGALEATLTPLMEQLESEHPVKVFSLPSVDHPQYGKHIELGVKGHPVHVATAFDAMLAALRGYGVELGPELVRS